MRLAVIVPRYGPGILGGAETLARGLAQSAAARGWQAEAWTTCAESHYTWENTLPAGEETLAGVRVRRFALDVWDESRQAELQIRLSGQGYLSPTEQMDWLACGPHSTGLYRHVAAHAAEFDAVIALPYAQPLIHYAAWAAPGRVLVLPCLHDEPYAYLEPVRLLLEGAAGVLFNAPEEAHLACKRLGMRLPRAAVLGVGVDADADDEPAAGPAAERLPAERPLLYVGRLEDGKNVPLLYEHFMRYAGDGGKLKLVVAGSGPVQPPAHPSIRFAGAVSDAERGRLCAEALALCQPSLNESFSFTMMQSWLAGRPVLVNGACAVTRGHVRRSQGGLWFGGYNEFAAALDWLQHNPAPAARMGENGRAYVQANYTWPVVLDRLERQLHAWRAGAAA